MLRPEAARQPIDQGTEGLWLPCGQPSGQDGLNGGLGNHPGQERYQPSTLAGHQHPSPDSHDQPSPLEETHDEAALLHRMA